MSGEDAARPGPLAAFRRDLAVAFVGHLARGGLGWLTFLILARRWHPSVFGLFALAEAVAQVAFHLSELGLATAVTRFVARGTRSGERAAVDGFLKTVFLAKVATAAIVFAAGQLAAPAIASGWLLRPETTPYLRIALVGLFGAHLSLFYQSYLGARLEFARNAAFISLAPFLQLALVLAAHFLDVLTVAAVLWIYALVPLLVCGLATIRLPHDFLRARSGRLATLAVLWRFSRWVYLTSTMGEVRFRLNSVFLSRLGPEHIRDVGLYNFADKMASTLTLFSSTLLTVLVPRVSHLVSHAEMREVLRRSRRYQFAIPLLALALPASFPLIRAFLPRYVEALPMLSVLFASVLFSLAAMPARAVLYSLGRPGVETAIEALALALTLVGGIVIVPAHGALGASLVMLVQRALSAALTIGWVHVKVVRPPPGEDDAGTQ